MRTNVLQIGVIRRAHGIRGQIRVQLHDPQSEALHTLTHVLAGPDQRPWELAAVQPLGRGAYLIQLTGVSDRDAAEALAGQGLYAERAELPPLTEGEFYLTDLVGLRAVTPDGTEAGRVGEVVTLAGQDLLVLHRPGRQEALVPIAQALVAVDIETGQVTIDPPEGLLDLDLPQRRVAGGGG